MSQMVTALSDSTFDEEVGAAEQPVLVDFWAEWCGPCKMVAPILDEIAEEHSGAIRIAKLNVDDNPDIARRYSVMSIPTLIVFRDGEEAARIIGARHAVTERTGATVADDSVRDLWEYAESRARERLGVEHVVDDDVRERRRGAVALRRPGQTGAQTVEVDEGQVGHGANDVTELRTALLLLGRLR